MTDETTLPAEITPFQLPANAPEAFLSPTSAAKYYLALRDKDRSPTDAPIELASGEDQSADPDNAVSDQAHGGDQAAEPGAEKPEPIAPPNSWTKAEKERFATLPRETQEYIQVREQEREREFRRGQNDLADQRKTVQAEREAAAKARQLYEAQLPQFLQNMEATQQASFADIRGVDDLHRLAEQDPLRYMQWQAHQIKLQAGHAELERVRSERSKAEQAEWNDHVQRENALAAEYIPELADKVKGPAMVSRVAQELLPELGFKTDELNALASGKQKLSVYDHRVQRLLATALKYADLQKASKAAIAKPLPPVQRPGTARATGSANSERISALTEQLNRTGSLKVAQELRALQSSQRRP
jgi:hypothetical protein